MAAMNEVAQTINFDQMFMMGFLNGASTVFDQGIWKVAGSSGELLRKSSPYGTRFEELFRCASVYPREVVKQVLVCNAAAVIFVHNHPSGDPEPSDADRRITQRLKEALGLVEILVIDHIVVGSEGYESLEERG